MIYLTEQTPVMIATAPADFRRGIDGFVALCQHQLGQQPRSGTVFAFINRSKTMIRLLVYENNGYWLMTKRLSKGKYRGCLAQQSR
ncbi:transposase [Ectothiorhodospiraceae bacterium BW-2]|nr:transposase [Ectothiorhodospiraceae bacterium BW-2]